MLTNSKITTTGPDPYDPPPSWWRRRAGWVWAVGAGALTALLTVISFPPCDVPEFAYAFAAPAVFWAYRRPSFRLYAATLFVAQAVAWTALLWWLHHVTWLGLFLLGPFIGAIVGAWYLAVWWAMPRLEGRPILLRITALFGLAGGWVLLEWLRTWFLSGFPWLPLAASQWQRTALLQIAAYTGAYGVSFLLILFNLGFAAYGWRLMGGVRYQGLRRRSPEFMAALIALVFGTMLPMTDAFNRAPYSRKLADVAFVQPYIPQSVKWDPAQGRAILETLEKATLVAAASGPDLILWPEATTPWAVRGDETVRDWIESLAARARMPLVLGSIAIEHRGRPDEAWYNGVFVVAPDLGLQTAYYAKRHLVPFGEYVPLRPVLGWLNKVVPVGDDDFRRGLSAAPLLVPLRHDSLAFGPLICFEDIFPALARADVRSGADLLFVATNNAWYGEGGAAYQHAAHSVLRAVETRRPVLRCGNGGWSGWIDEFGVVRDVLTNDRGSIYYRGVKTLPVKRDARWIGRTSFYVEHGDWFVAVCAGLVALGWLSLKFGGTTFRAAGVGDASQGPV
ncbi:MAG: apolipoprotein N-acyltransferase [Opitutaceae bacterium]